MNEIKIALRELEFSISALIKLKSDSNLDIYYLAYAKVAHLKIKHGNNALDGNILHWLYESIRTENYE